MFKNMLNSEFPDNLIFIIYIFITSKLAQARKTKCVFPSLYYIILFYGGGGGGLVTKSCLTLATPWIIAHQFSSVLGISQARILE